jgi:hypothetical protein
MLYITSRHLCVWSIRVGKSKKLRRKNKNTSRGKREERRREKEKEREKERSKGGEIQGEMGKCRYG